MSTFDDSADRSSETGSDGPGALEELIAHYLDFLTSGQTLDRLQILADHPDLGPRILENLQEYIDLQAGSPAESELGTIGDYRLRRQIGRGGMGIVYEAWQTSMDRRVALKVLPAGVAADQRTFVRFLREARAAGKLNHPNVVSVYGMGVKEETPYYAMEYVEGETLAQVLARLQAAEGAEAPEWRR